MERRSFDDGDVYYVDGDGEFVEDEDDYSYYGDGDAATYYGDETGDAEKDIADLAAILAANLEVPLTAIWCSV